VAEKHGHAGLPEGTIHIALTGSAGQSFGAFLARGITLELIGDANDYTGKGLSGGRLIVRPHADFRGNPQENIIIGNTVMYGAIDGEAYFRGVAGERFLVRNSGGTAVVEGVGDHGCEYMTGGTCVVLGGTGRNFAGGMSGGIAYVYNPAGGFKNLCNLSMVDLEAMPAPGQTPAELRHHGEDDDALLRRLIENHARFTGSDVAKAILGNWQVARSMFVKVFPKEYRRALKELAAKEAQLAK